MATNGPGGSLWITAAPGLTSIIWCALLVHLAAAETNVGGSAAASHLGFSGATIEGPGAGSAGLFSTRGLGASRGAGAGVTLALATTAGFGAGGGGASTTVSGRCHGSKKPV